MPLDSPESRVHGNCDRLLESGSRRENCLYCGGPIKKPRIGKDFCQDKCRWKWNNNEKKRAFERFARKFIEFLKQEGLDYLLK